MVLEWKLSREMGSGQRECVFWSRVCLSLRTQTPPVTTGPGAPAALQPCGRCGPAAPAQVFGFSFILAEYSG